MSRHLPRKLRLGALLLALVPAAGCGGSAPAMSSSLAEGTIAGTIKVDGQPVSQGQVTFDPSSNVRKDASPRTAPIGKDGTYTITTLIGRNRVRFTGISSKRNVSFEEMAHQVQPGSMTFDINLTPTQPRGRR